MQVRQRKSTPRPVVQSPLSSTDLGLDPSRSLWNEGTIYLWHLVNTPDMTQPNRWIKPELQDFLNANYFPLSYDEFALSEPEVSKQAHGMADDYRRR